MHATRLLAAATLAVPLLAAAPTAAGATPVVCDYRAPTVLPLPAGFSSASVVGIDAAGDLAGNVFKDLVPQAAIWAGTRVRLLPAPAGRVPVATAINSHGVAVGQDDTTGRAMVWQSGTAQPLPDGRPAVPVSSAGAVVAEDGTIAGTIAETGSGAARPAIWRCR
jgi:hypothetical protein